jgi:hypothetical protein
MLKQRRRYFKQTVSLKDRLTSFARETLKMASRLPPGRERDDLVNRAKQASNASHLDDWINSPGLKRPK